MVWPILTIIALIALAVVHLRWRHRCFLTRESARLEIESLKQDHQREFLQIQTRQSALFDSMIEGLLLLDENGKIQLANRAFTNLLDISSPIHGRTILEVLRQHELTELLEKVASEKQVDGYELKLGGLQERWLQVNAAALPDSEGARNGTILVFHDLTRLKQLERTREEFVANVSHELRTPLSLIRGYVETLLDGAKDNPEVATKFLETIQRNSGRLQFLIEDLLTISELESGRLKMNLQSVQLRRLIEKVLEDFKIPAAGRRVTLTNDVPELIAHADADRLQQLLGNLIGGMLELCVQDDVPGIPTEALDRVFERFYRVDKARSREQGGTGLGLSIVKHIAQGHGGKVWVKSQPGQGAAFFFTLVEEKQI